MDKTVTSRGMEYAKIALVIGVIIGILITPFLVELLSSVAQIFGSKYWGYRSPFDPAWVGVVSAITSSFFTLIISQELLWRKKNTSKLDTMIILLKFIGIFLLMWLVALLFNPAYDFVCKLIC